MLLIFLVIFAIALTILCIYALMKSASNADDITEALQESFQEDFHKK